GACGAVCGGGGGGGGGQKSKKNKGAEDQPPADQQVNHEAINHGLAALFIGARTVAPTDAASRVSTRAPLLFMGFGSAPGNPSGSARHRVRGRRSADRARICGRRHRGSSSNLGCWARSGSWPVRGCAPRARQYAAR